MPYDFVIIGGGFFGCSIALHLRRRGFERIVVIERERNLLERASYRNQARVHNGYHYPRSYVTAYRSRVNLRRFCREYAFAVDTDFVMLYAVAARRSNVTPRQFERFMRDIGARYETAGSGYRSLFDPALVAGVYVVEEYAFNPRLLREYFARELAAGGIDVRLGTESTRIWSDDNLRVELSAGATSSSLSANAVLNCTYSCLNRNVRGCSQMTSLKHEQTEVALVEVPDALAGVGITVMDGPFFSCMPFPAEGCHSLTHVRYTPHGFFFDVDGSCDPSREIEVQPLKSKAEYMIADAARYVPRIKSAQWRRSLFEAKTVLVHNELDDGRPVLLRRDAYPRLFSVLGAKIDNIYDVLAQIDATFANTGAATVPAAPIPITLDVSRR